MTVPEIIMVGVGGFFGAIIRFFISQRMNKVKRIPHGTLTVNLLGSLLIGVIFGMELSRIWLLFFASGLAGALTTFSTMNKEFIVMWKDERQQQMIRYVIISYGVGIILAHLGYLIGSSIS